jgi:hypothetical protein
MTIQELTLYETPKITEFISIKWIQNLIAIYVAKKVLRKVKRYNSRLKMKEFVEFYSKKDLTT